MTRSIVIVCEEKIAHVLSHVWTHVLPEADIDCVGTAMAVESALQLPPDIVLIDWSFEGIKPAELFSTLHARPSYSSCVLAAICHDQHQSSLARNSGVDLIIDLTVSAGIEQLLLSNFLTLKKLSAAYTHARDLEREVRNARANIEDVVNVLQSAIHTRYPDAALRARFIEEACMWIAGQFEHEEDAEIDREQLRYASKLVMIGRLHLPDTEKTTTITLDGAARSVLTAAVPLKANDILKESEYLAGARSILKSLYENYDGTGFPDRIQHWQIPLASRILRVVIDAEGLCTEMGGRYSEALEEIKKLARRVYDNRVVILLEEYVNVVAKRSKNENAPTSVLLVDLQEGMTLAGDIVTNAGLKLMNAGTVLRSHLIDRLMSHNTMDPILGNIYVHTPKAEKV